MDTTQLLFSFVTSISWFGHCLVNREQRNHLHVCKELFSLGDGRPEGSNCVQHFVGKTFVFNIHNEVHAIVILKILNIEKQHRGIGSYFNILNIKRVGV